MESTGRESIKPSGTALQRQRHRLTWRGELALAALPTATVLGVLGLVEMVTEQRLLFASLASSAFLIYLDPEHGTNRVRALVVSQLLGASLGWATYVMLGTGYGGAALALVATILAMILLDVVHPPAVSTAMGFALRAGDASNLGLFVLALGLTVVLVLLQRSALWLLVHFRAAHHHEAGTPESGTGGRS